jgi:hypothetical protein
MGLNVDRVSGRGWQIRAICSETAAANPWPTSAFSSSRRRVPQSDPVADIVGGDDRSAIDGGYDIARLEASTLSGRACAEASTSERADNIRRHGLWETFVGKVESETGTFAQMPSPA